MLSIIISKLIYLIISLLEKTYRFRYIGLENLTEAKKISTHGNYLLAVWHQNILHGILAQGSISHVVIISKNKDADPVAYACQKFGHIVTRGSSMKEGVNKGGKAAKEQMIQNLIDGYPGAVSVDGPKGPAKEVKPGIIDMAKKSGHPIIPYAPIPESFWQFNSWDKFKLPKPFSKIIIFYGKPIHVQSNVDYSSFHEIKLEIKRSLNLIQSEASSSFTKKFQESSKENLQQST